MKIHRQLIVVSCFGSIITMCIMFYMLGNSHGRRHAKKEIRTVLVYTCTPEVSDSSIIRLCNKYNIKFPHIVAAQARLETANYSSSNFMINNNLFGMKSNERFTVGEPNGIYQYYFNWTMSIIDYGIWQYKHLPKHIETEEDYLLWLEKYGYAEDSLYTKKLYAISKNLNL